MCRSFVVIIVAATPLQAALRAGEELLRAGAPAMDAVVAAVRVMEDSPLFNAGKGAVFTHNGSVEMDASVMDGHSGQAGGVGGVQVRAAVTGCCSVCRLPVCVCACVLLQWTD